MRIPDELMVKTYLEMMRVHFTGKPLQPKKISGTPTISNYIVSFVSILMAYGVLR